jgi:hypothetical protein
MPTTNIQNLIDNVKSGGVLKLDPPKKEYEGPIVIRKPITIEGQHSTFWAKEKGPVLSIESSGVIINDLNIEITGKEDELSGKDACALVVGDKLGISLNNVSVRGNVLGLDEEEGDWLYPRSIKLSLKSGKPNDFKAKIVAPVPCSLKSEIAGLTVHPSGIKGGKETEITLRVEALPEGVRLRGTIILKTAFLCRIIQVRSEKIGKNDECNCKVTYWDTLAAKTPPSTTPEDTKTLPKHEPSPSPEPKRKREKEDNKYPVLSEPENKKTPKPKPYSTPSDLFNHKDDPNSIRRKGHRYQGEDRTSLSDYWADSKIKSENENRMDEQKATTKLDITDDNSVGNPATNRVSKEEKKITSKDIKNISSGKKRNTISIGDLSEALSAFSPLVDNTQSKQEPEKKDDNKKQKDDTSDDESEPYSSKQPSVRKKRKTISWDGGPTAFGDNT